METKITKKEKLLSVRNCWNAADYYLIHGRMYNDSKTAYRKFKFVLWMDLATDLHDGESDIPYDEALEEMIFSFVDIAGNDYNNRTAIENFYSACNDTIRRWNAQ